MSTVRIGIIAAMESELYEILAEMYAIQKNVISGMAFYEGSIRGTRAVLALSGIGKVCAAMCAQTMILTYSPAEILCAGIAGSLKMLRPGDIAVASDLVQHDFILSAFGYEEGYLPAVHKVHIPCDIRMADALEQTAADLGVRCARGTIASGDCFVNTTEKKNYIVETFDAIACEMEGAAIAQVCALNEIPFCVLRCISDSGDEAADDDFGNNEALSTAGVAAVAIEYAGRLSQTEQDERSAFSPGGNMNQLVYGPPEWFETKRAEEAPFPSGSIL